MIKRIILFGLMLFMFSNSYCQTSEINLIKYWKLRERLKQNFIIEIGDCQGCSLPASERVRSNNGGIVSAKIKWGDATAYLSMYISVLATEYHLLTQNPLNPQNASETLRELYYAIHAFNRLDLNAENSFPLFVDPCLMVFSFGMT